MNFYQVDNLHAIIARLGELKASETRYCLTLAHLCDAGECALRANTETAYNTFMDECGAVIAKMNVEM